MILCLLAGGKTVAIAATAFTLSWTHSVEKTRWEEDWRVNSRGLELVEARIAGSGAGMEVPDGAVLDGGVWTYRPDLPIQQVLVLARSGATSGGWELCWAGGCMTVGAEAGEPASLKACKPDDQ